MHKKLFLFFLFLIFSTLFSYPETIKLKNGKTIEAKIIEKTDTAVKLDINGASVAYFLDEIESITGKSLSSHEEQAGSGPKAPRDIFKSVSPAIVSIFLRTPKREQLLGTGFVIDSQGIFITELHVFSATTNNSVLRLKDGYELPLISTKNVIIKLKDGGTYPIGEKFVVDVKRDIFIAEIKAKNLACLSFGDAQATQVGDTVYVIGNPLGLEYSFSNGMLSGTREIDKDYDKIKLLQFTAPIAPGSSGGPLLNTQGQVIGIVSLTAMPETGGQNLNFALAIDEIYNHLGRLYLLLGQEAQSLNYFNKIIQLRPERAWQYYADLALTYKEDLGQFPKAKENLKKAIDLLKAQGKYQDAQEAETLLKEIP
jgi:V8-like Glu-specific endopeptidase